MPRLAVQAALTLLINTLIAAFLTAIGTGADFPTNLVFSYCIGFSIFVPCIAVIRLAPSRGALFVGLALAIVLGAGFGVALGLALTGQGLEKWSSPEAGQALLIGLMFGAAVSYLFYSRERMVALEAELRERELRRMEADKARMEAQLRMLQAQIEPHFLFNTLANLSALIRTDPALAERMLADLIRYLRATLQRTREQGATLGDEIGFLRAYLDILAQRMGDRLRWTLDVPAGLLERGFPPMLLQPLVENAVTHGIEPKIGGGEVRVEGRLENGRLRLVVSDSGVGLRGANAGTGLGLENVRQRLRALYGEAARLDVRENGGSGVTAVIEVPA